jgi:hypothetical protein
MNAAVLAAAGLTALSIFMFRTEAIGLTEAHARPRTQVLNSARWGIVIALAWVLIPAALAQPGPERAATIFGLAALIGAMMLVPVRWFIRLGGLERAWELRRAKIETARLANMVRRDRSSVTLLRLRTEIARIEALRTPENAELCDLMIAELNDIISGEESWNEAGRRSIRLDEIGRKMWPDAMPAPDFDPDEATFRWLLYRTFGRMMQLGAEDRSRDSIAEFNELKGSLRQFKRRDTTDFLAAVKTSAEGWLKERKASRPWIESFEFEALGPGGLAAVRAIWGRDAALWGADLDEDDRRAILEDLAIRSPLAAAEPTEPTVADGAIG